MEFTLLEDENFKPSGGRGPALQIAFSFEGPKVIENRPGVDVELLANFPYGRRITSFLNERFDETKYLFLSRCQFHFFLPNCRVLYICLVVKGDYEIPFLWIR